jgi:phosphatidylserine/phosphatidylglycerophosphate/cardiolipin synthase-like enzyme
LFLSECLMHKNDDPLGPLPLRSVPCELVSGKTLYTRVVQQMIARAKVSVWIATANLKGLWVESLGGGLKQSAKFVGAATAHKTARRTAKRASVYVSVFEHFVQLASRGVSVRILHSGVPSTPFAQELIAHKQLLRSKRATDADCDPPLALRRCPRVHLKLVIVDGTQLYLGSANFTGAGLGAKGQGRRNFELGIITEDDSWLDETQALYERIWMGKECAHCGMRPVCPQPIDKL